MHMFNRYNIKDNLLFVVCYKWDAVVHTPIVFFLKVVNFSYETPNIDRNKKWTTVLKTTKITIINVEKKYSHPEIGDTGRERLIRSHSSARFSFELSGNSN